MIIKRDHMFIWREGGPSILAQWVRNLRDVERAHRQRDAKNAAACRKAERSRRRRHYRGRP